MLGHFGFMGAVSFPIIGVGLLASLRAGGRKLTAWVVGALSAALGIASPVFPDVESRMDLPSALTATGWGIAFVVSAQRRLLAGATSASPST